MMNKCLDYRMYLLWFGCLFSFLFCRISLAQPGQLPVLKDIPYTLSWVNNPEHYNIENEVLTISSGPRTDIFRDPDETYHTSNAPRLVFKPKGDFILTACIQHSFSSKWDGGALFVQNDSLNWVKFCYERDYTNARRVVSVVTRNFSDDNNSVEGFSDKAWFRLARKGKIMLLYYSADGKKWLLVRHFRFDFVENQTAVGFLAQSPEGNGCTVTFSGIRFEERSISDPYIGN